LDEYNRNKEEHRESLRRDWEATTPIATPTTEPLDASGDPTTNAANTPLGLYDEDGNPLDNEDGNPLNEDDTPHVNDGNPLDNNNPLDDVDGNPPDADGLDDDEYNNNECVDNDGNPLYDDDGNPLDDDDVDNHAPDEDDDATTDDDEQTDDNNISVNNDGHNDTNYSSDDDEPSADALNDGNYDGYDDAGYDDEYNNISGDYDDNYNDEYYEDDDSYDDNGCHSHSNHNKGYNTDYIDKIAEEFEKDLHLLWDTFLSLTSHTSVAVDHQTNHPVRTTTTPQPFKLVDSTSPGGVLSTSTGRVNCGRNQLYELIGLKPPPPKMSRFNLPRLRLHTGQRHGPRAPTTHLVMVFPCGTRHQPRASNHLAMELPLIGLQHRYEMF
jgi:hypothetical protein